MLINSSDPVHLTYCLNVHPGETFEDQWAAVRTHAAAVRARLGRSNSPFGLGLRLGAAAVRELQDTDLLHSFRDWCGENGFYVFTVNGFPYGTFHDTQVKADVYRPDWTTPERLEYTIALADILGVLLPPGTAGSISTVPLWYAPDHGPDALKAAEMEAVRNLAACARHLEKIEQDTGKSIRLALEPEPWCALETCGDVIAFFEGAAASLPRDRIAVCLDTCHCALAFEEPADVMTRLEAVGIRVGKIQLSAALKVGCGSREAVAALTPFAEPIYFHQVAQRTGGNLTRWPDLDRALPELDTDGEGRVHFHVPLQWEGGEVLQSTRGNMDGAFWRAIREARCDHLEIETYTFDVLPKSMGIEDLTASIEAEYRWVLGKLGVVV